MHQLCQCTNDAHPTTTRPPVSSAFKVLVLPDLWLLTQANRNRLPTFQANNFSQIGVTPPTLACLLSMQSTAPTAQKRLPFILYLFSFPSTSPRILRQTDSSARA